MASISKVKRNKGYTYRAFIRRKGLKPITKTFSSRELAERFVDRIEGDRELLLAYGGSREYQIILKELISRYLKEEYTGKDAQKQSARLQFWADRYGHKFISEITRVDISSGLYELSKSLSNATVNRYRSVLSVVFSYACRHYELPDNPVHYIPSKLEDNARIRFLSDDERARLFGAVKQSSWDKLYLLVLLAITTGARKGELVNLRWSDVDLDRQTAFISTTKNGQPKVLPLTDSIIVELGKFVRSDNSLIFNSEITMDKPFCFYKQWKKVLLSADIKDFRFHDLRHTTASYLAQSGASLLEIADVLGHKQISMTARYSHLCIEHKTKLVNNVLGSIGDREYASKQR